MRFITHLNNRRNDSLVTPMAEAGRSLIQEAFDFALKATFRFHNIVRHTLKVYENAIPTESPSASDPYSDPLPGVVLALGDLRSPGCAARQRRGMAAFGGASRAGF